MTLSLWVGVMPRLLHQSPSPALITTSVKLVAISLRIKIHYEKMGWGQIGPCLQESPCLGPRPPFLTSTTKPFFVSKVAKESAIPYSLVRALTSSLAGALSSNLIPLYSSLFGARWASRWRPKFKCGPFFSIKVRSSFRILRKLFRHSQRFGFHQCNWWQKAHTHASYCLLYSKKFQSCLSHPKTLNKCINNLLCHDMRISYNHYRTLGIQR